MEEQEQRTQEPAGSATIQPNITVPSVATAPATPLAASPPTAAATATNGPSAAQIVWQWVCYGLWQWALIALSILLSATLTYFFFDKSADYDFTVYVLATILCLLPPAYFVDKAYAKREPEQKHGFAAVVMVLNAVLVFLATLGALIVAVVSLLSLFINAAAGENTGIALVSSLVVAVLSGMLFVRILNPPKLHVFSKWFPLIVVVVAGLTLILNIAGPFTHQLNTRQDRLVEDKISILDGAIQNHTSSYGKLPEKLTDLSFAEYEKEARVLVDRSLVTYEVIKAVPANEANKNNTLFQNIEQSGGVSITPAEGTGTRQGTYRLCTTYEHSKGNGTAPSGTISYIDTANHPAGKTCYQRTAAVYGDLKPL